MNQKEALEYWQEIWSKREDAKDHKQLIETLKDDYIDININDIDINDDKIKRIIDEALKKLPNWRASGPEKVYNFFIKKITSLHNKLKNAITEAVKNPETIDESFYTGTTYLLPKKDNASQPEETRPITCLPNIIKLINKVNTELVYETCELNNIISKTQMGTRRRCQGAKEQALINKFVNNKTNHTGSM